MRVPQDTVIYASGRPIPVRLFVTDAIDKDGNAVAHPVVTVAAAPQGWTGDNGTASRVAPMFAAAAAADTTITPQGDQGGTVKLVAGLDTASMNVLAQIDMKRYTWRAVWTCVFASRSETDAAGNPLDSAHSFAVFDTALVQADSLSTLLGPETRTILGVGNVVYGTETDTVFGGGKVDVVSSYQIYHIADELVVIDSLFVGSGLDSAGHQAHFIRRVNANTAAFPHLAGSTSAYCPSIRVNPSTGKPIVGVLDFVAIYDKTTQTSNPSPSRVVGPRILDRRS